MRVAFRNCSLGLLLMGLAAAQGATPEEAVRFHRSRVAGRPGDVQAMSQLARALVRRAESTGEARDYDEAWRILAEADRLEPRTPGILRDRAALLLSRHRFPQARALAEAGLKKHPQETDLHGIAGDAALETGDLDAATSHYQDFDKAQPGFLSQVRLAHLEELRGRFDVASEMMSRAYESAQAKGALAETLGWCRAVWGEFELKAKRPAAARKQYQLGLAESPDHPLVLEHLAELELIEGNNTAAEVAYRKILERNLNPVIQLRLAKLIEVRDPAEATRIRRETQALLTRLVDAGNEGYLRPLARLEFEQRDFLRAAILAFHDLALRPTLESRTLLNDILRAAAEAGEPLNELSVKIQQLPSDADQQ